MRHLLLFPGLVVASLCGVGGCGPSIEIQRHSTVSYPAQVASAPLPVANGKEFGLAPQNLASAVIASCAGRTTPSRRRVDEATEVIDWKKGVMVHGPIDHLATISIRNSQKSPAGLLEEINELARKLGSSLIAVHHTTRATFRSGDTLITDVTIEAYYVDCSALAETTVTMRRSAMAVGRVSGG